ncbi:MAG: PaREP1 family protein [Pyrobaculum sp.]
MSIVHPWKNLRRYVEIRLDEAEADLALRFLEEGLHRNAAGKAFQAWKAALTAAPTGKDGGTTKDRKSHSPITNKYADWEGGGGLRQGEGRVDALLEKPPHGCEQHASQYAEHRRLDFLQGEGCVYVRLLPRG